MIKVKIDNETFATIEGFETIPLKIPTFTEQVYNDIKIKNSIIEKEGNKMIESMNLIDLYANKHKENINKEAKESEKKLKENNDIINKYNELVKQFEINCDELYLSQFSENEKEDVILTQNIDDNNMPLQRSFSSLNKYRINLLFRPKEYEEKIETPYREKSQELDNLIKTVKAHIGIAKTKEEVEEILTRYGIIDKNGKLVLK